MSCPRSKLENRSTCDWDSPILTTICTQWNAITRRMKGDVASLLSRSMSNYRRTRRWIGCWNLFNNLDNRRTKPQLSAWAVSNIQGNTCSPERTIWRWTWIDAKSTPGKRKVRISASGVVRISGFCSIARLVQPTIDPSPITWDCATRNSTRISTLAAIDLNSTTSLAQCTPGDRTARFGTRLAGLKRRRTHGKFLSSARKIKRLESYLFFPPYLSISFLSVVITRFL